MKIKSNKSILERVVPIVEPIFADLFTKAGTRLDLNGNFVLLFLVFLEDDGHRVLLFLATLNFEEQVVHVLITQDKLYLNLIKIVNTEYA